MPEKSHLNRRRFLKHSAAGLVGAGAAVSWAGGQENETPKPKIKGYRILGRTGFKVSDLGTGSIQDEGVLRAALEAGINFIDTAEQYPGHHKIVGNAIKGLDRKSLFICSKMEMKGEITKEGILKRTRKALEEIGTEYLDCMMMHFPETVATLSTEGYHQAMRQLKSEGRVHFTGASHHGSFWLRAPEVSMESILGAAADDGRFDVFLLAYNFLQMDASEKILRLCREKKIGAALMKTTPINTFNKIKSSVERLKEQGKEINPLYTDGLDNYTKMVERAQAFLKENNLEDPVDIKKAAILFVLDNRDVNTVCATARNFDELEMWLSQSGRNLSASQRALLNAYEKNCGRLYCRHACGLCEPNCPSQVPVNTIMRFHHYFTAQGREREAMEKYSRLPGPDASGCAQCQGHCLKACPYGVPVQGMLMLAHNQLTLA
jgi:predicted aldo/keto reductase-like oxidoreductase